MYHRAGSCSRFSARYCCGVLPVHFLKHEEKYVDDENPTRSAISVTVMAVLGWAVILIWAEGLCRLFGANEQYMDIYARTMRMYNVTLPLVPVSLLGANVFQSIGKPKKAILLSLTRQVFALLPAVLLLPLIFGVDGVVSAMPVCDVISFTIGTLMVSRELREIRQMRDGRLPAHE